MGRIILFIGQFSKDVQRPNFLTLTMRVVVTKNLLWLAEKLYSQNWREFHQLSCVVILWQDQLQVQKKKVFQNSEEEICSDLWEVRMNLFSSELFTIKIFRNMLRLTKLPLSLGKKIPTEKLLIYLETRRTHGSNDINFLSVTSLVFPQNEFKKSENDRDFSCDHFAFF